MYRKEILRYDDAIESNEHILPWTFTKTNYTVPLIDGLSDRRVGKAKVVKCGPYYYQIVICDWFYETYEHFHKNNMLQFGGFWKFGDNYIKGIYVQGRPAVRKLS